MMTAARAGYVLLSGSILACSPGPIASDASTTASETTSSESVATTTESESDTDVDPGGDCVLEPAPSTDCNPIGQPMLAIDVDVVGYTPDGGESATLEVGPDGVVHVLSPQDYLDSDFTHQDVLTHQTNASGVWSMQRYQSPLATNRRVALAISPSGLLHLAAGSYARGTNGTFVSANTDIEPHNLLDIAWSRNDEFGYAYGNAYWDNLTRGIWSINGDCLTLEWIEESCDQTRRLAVGPDDRLHILQISPLHSHDGFTLLTIDGDTVSSAWLSAPDPVEVLLGDFIIDGTGTMHTCYAGNSGPNTLVYVQFTEFGDWEELSIPDLPGPWANDDNNPCSIAVNEEGTIVWMSSPVADDRIARIEDGVAAIISAAPPIENEADILHDIALDEIGQPIVIGKTSLNGATTDFVMRLVDDAWQVEHSFTIP